jgi:uncharacterized protein YbaR (Trm112 family)
MNSDPILPGDVLQLLRCPQTGSRLRLVPAAMVAVLNSLIAAGQVYNQVGELLDRQLQGGLVNEASSLLYPIYDHGPTLIADEAIPLTNLTLKNVC